MFKVGDKVRAPEGYHNDFTGGEGIVQEVDGDYFSILVTKASKHYNVGQVTTTANWYWDNDSSTNRVHLEKITEEKTTDTQKIFHVGDICKDTDEGCSCATRPEYLVKILAVADGGRRVTKLCNVNDEEDTCSGHESSLVIVTPADSGPQPPVVVQSVYSDGVKVSDTEVYFEGKTWKRDDLKATVKRYQEVLRRPVATETAKVKAKSVKRTTKANGKSKKA